MLLLIHEKKAFFQVIQASSTVNAQLHMLKRKNNITLLTAIFTVFLLLKTEEQMLRYLRMMGAVEENTGDRYRDSSDLLKKSVQKG